jgi:RNA polymerase sigma-70 factor, ECF subfamily
MTDWSELAARHGPAVWRTAYRLLGCEADAADCFQETFLSAVRVESAEAVANWGGLLRRLAVARGLDLLRRRRRERERQGPWAVGEDALARCPGPPEEAQGRELAGRLRLALSELPAREAEVFCLRCMEELTYEEIASRLGLRVNAVGVLLHHARRRLGVLLEKKEVIGDRS